MPFVTVPCVVMKKFGVPTPDITDFNERQRIASTLIGLQTEAAVVNTDLVCSVAPVTGITGLDTYPFCYITFATGVTSEGQDNVMAVAGTLRQVLAALRHRPEELAARAGENPRWWMREAFSGPSMILTCFNTGLLAYNIWIMYHQVVEC